MDSYGKPNIVWSQTTQCGRLPVIDEIFYSCFDGVNWSPPENITNLGLRADYPKIVINNLNVKCLLFIFWCQLGDPYVNYSFGIDSNWTYPDTVLDRYACLFSTITTDDNDVFHACIGPAFNPYCDDIVYTYFQQYSLVGEMPTEPPSDYKSISSYPNPFNQSTTITYTIPGKSEINLSIFNIYGQIVKTVESGSISGGSHINHWDGTDQFGKEVSAGLYFLRLQVNDESTVRKVVLIK